MHSVPFFLQRAPHVQHQHVQVGAHQHQGYGASRRRCVWAGSGGHARGGRRRWRISYAWAGGGGRERGPMTEVARTREEVAGSKGGRTMAAGGARIGEGAAGSTGGQTTVSGGVRGLAKEVARAGPWRKSHAWGRGREDHPGPSMSHHQHLWSELLDGCDPGGITTAALGPVRARSPPMLF